MDRSGAVAMGLSAINQYVGLKDGENTLTDYVNYVRNDLMGVTREDLVANIAATWILRFTSSRSGDCPYGKTKRASMSMKDAGS